jgi:hypothetical protein
MRQATELQRRLDEYNEGVMEREIANLRAKDMALVALTQAMTAELEALRAFRDSIPCAAIRNVAFAALRGDIAGSPAVEVLGWLAEVAPTPKEAAE